MRQGLVAGTILMTAPVLLTIMLTPILASKAGMVRRRGVKSASYSNLVSPKDALAGAEALVWWQAWRTKNAQSRK